MKTIWKFDMQPGYPVFIPKGAQLLTVRMKDGYPNLWFIVDPNAEKEKRIFNLYATGQPLPDDPGEYIDTFFINGESVVLHAFEVVRKIL